MAGFRVKAVAIAFGLVSAAVITAGAARGEEARRGAPLPLVPPSLAAEWTTGRAPPRHAVPEFQPAEAPGVSKGGSAGEAGAVAKPPAGATIPGAVPFGAAAPDAPLSGAVEGGGGAIEVDTLPEPDTAYVGVLEEGQGGLGVGLWKGTDRATAAELISKLPAASRSLVARDLMHRLLLTNAAAPEGSGSGTGLVSLRLDRLLAAGDLEGFSRLLGAVPARAIDGEAARAQVEVLLLQGDRDGACQAAERRIAEDESPFYQRVMIFCQALAGEHDKAALGLEIMREEGQAEADGTFVTLVHALAGDAGARVETLSKPTALTLAMMEAAAQELPAGVLTSLPPPILRAVARNQSAPLTVRLQATERAVSLGLLSPDVLAALYGTLTFTDDDFAEAVRIGAAAFGLEARALLYQAARRQIDPAARARILQRMWGLAAQRGIHELVARTTVPLLKGVPPDPALAWFAPDAVRAALAAAHVEEARAWYDLLRDRSGRESMLVTALWPLMLVATAEDPAWEQASLERWALMQRSVHGPQAEARLALLYALLSGLGLNEGHERDWSLLLPGPVRTEVDALPDAWRPLSEAGAAGRRGETVLRVLVAVGEGRPADLPPAALRVAIGALRAVGLQPEARGFALEAALEAGL